MAKKTLTTNQGVPVADNQSSLTAGQRGPILQIPITARNLRSTTTSGTGLCRMAPGSPER